MERGGITGDLLQKELLDGRLRLKKLQLGHSELNIHDDLPSREWDLADLLQLRQLRELVVVDYQAPDRSLMIPPSSY